MSSAECGSNVDCGKLAICDVTYEYCDTTILSCRPCSQCGQSYACWGLCKCYNALKYVTTTTTTQAPIRPTIVNTEEQAISGLDIALIVIALVFLVGLVVIGVLVWHLYKKRNQRDPDLNQNGEQTVPLEPAANGPHLQNGDVIIVGEAVTAGPQGDVPRDPPLSHTSNGYTTGAARYPRDNSVGQSATSMTDDYPHGRNTYPCDTLNDQSVNSMSNGRHTGTPPRENFIDQSESRIHNSAPGLVATSGGRGPYAQPESARYNNGRTTYHGMPVAKPTN